MHCEAHRLGKRALREHSDHKLLTEFYEQLCESEVEEAFTKPRGVNDKEQKHKLWRTVKQAKYGIKRCVRARIQQAWEQAATRLI